MEIIYKYNGKETVFSKETDSNIFVFANITFSAPTT